MKFLELANKRRSCREYTAEVVSREAIERCLEAARLAPSACNSQPWHFIVIESPELKDKVAKEAFSGIHSTNAFAKDAAVLILAIREQTTYLTRLGGYFRGLRFSLIDLGVACEHFILQAEEEGLGTCWIGWFNERRVKKLLKIPRSKKIDIIISLGYPKNQQTVSKARKLLPEISEFR